MFHDRTGARRKNARAFRPVLDGVRLEARQLLTTTVAALVKNQYLLTHPSPAAAKSLNDPVNLTSHAPFYAIGPSSNKGVVDVQTARGGASVIVATPDGSRFRISLSLADNQYDGGLSAETGGSGNLVVPSTVTQPVGTVRAYAMPGGQVGLIVDGTTQYQQLTIDPLPVVQRKGYAHSFGYDAGGRTHILNIGSIQINSGMIQAVLGFHSANLTGPLSIGGTGTVDRIAFNSLQPGASIGVGGTLNTLDIANAATLVSGPGVHIGGDLNLLNVGGNLTLANGAVFYVGRDMGLTLQPPKGTGTGSNILSVNIPTITNSVTTVTPNPSVSAYIQGDVIIGPGSGFTVARQIDQAFYVLGNVAGASRARLVGTTITVSNPNYIAGSTNPATEFPTKSQNTAFSFIKGTITP